jgi:hypothetical protein
MHPQESVFERIEAALHTLDATTDARIKAVDDRLGALGVTVEVHLNEPVDASGDTSLHLGYARIAGRFCLTVKRVPHAAGEAAQATVQPLHSADRATRIAAVDQLPALLDALEAELKRRARIGEPAAAAKTPIEIVAAAPAKVPVLPEIAPATVGEVDVPLRAVPTVNAGPSQDSVDHMFRLFSRKGR